MRLIYSTLNDIRYQSKYGFYFLYALMTILYITILSLVSIDYKDRVASLILLTDPAALGFFFIGGIWLLEKEEGIHLFHGASPLLPIEYCLAKTISLAIISTLSGILITIVSLSTKVNFVFLFLGMFLGSGIFTLLGLSIATYAKSVNHYMLLNIIPGSIMVIPALLTAFGIKSSLFEVFPATILWHIIDCSIRGQAIKITYILGLIFWLIISIIISNHRVSTVLQSKEGARN